MGDLWDRLGLIVIGRNGWKEFGAGASRTRAANNSDKFPPFHVRHRVSQGIVAVRARFTEGAQPVIA